MARTTLTVNELSPLVGVVDLLAAEEAPTTDGAMYRNNAPIWLYVRNSGAGSHTVTVVTGKTVQSLSLEDPVFTFAAGKAGILGPFSPGLFNQPTDADNPGYVLIDCSGTQAEVKMYAFKHVND